MTLQSGAQGNRLMSRCEMVQRSAVACCLARGRQVSRCLGHGPGNRQAAAAILAERTPEIRPEVLGAVMNSLLSQRSRLTPNGAILREGASIVLDLRSRYGSGTLPLLDVDKYLSWLDRARSVGT
jgi:hypothetical protein